MQELFFNFATVVIFNQTESNSEVCDKFNIVFFAAYCLEKDIFLRVT